MTENPKVEYVLVFPNKRARKACKRDYNRQQGLVYNPEELN